MLRLELLLPLLRLRVLPVLLLQLPRQLHLRMVRLLLGLQARLRRGLSARLGWLYKGQQLLVPLLPLLQLVLLHEGQLLLVRQAEALLRLELLPLLLLLQLSGSEGCPAGASWAGSRRCGADQLMCCSRKRLLQHAGGKQCLRLCLQLCAVSWRGGRFLRSQQVLLPRSLLHAGLQLCRASPSLAPLPRPLRLLLVFICRSMRSHVFSSCAQALQRNLAVAQGPPLSLRNVAGGAAQRTQSTCRRSGTAAAPEHGIQPLTSLQQSFLLVALEEAHRLH